MSGSVVNSLAAVTRSAKAALAVLSSAFGLLVASMVAAQAVKVHRQPNEAALQTLGLSGVSFKPYL